MKMKTVKFDSAQKALVLSLVLLFCLAGSVVLMFWGGQSTFASYWHTKALSGEDMELQKRADYLYKAANVGRSNDAIWRDLSQVLLRRVANLAQQEPSEDEKKNQAAMQELGQVSKNAIFAAQNARDIDKANPLNWENLGDVYSNLIPYAQGSSDKAVSAYEEGLKRDPKSPSLHLKKARAKYALVNRLSRQIAQLKKAGSQSRQAKAKAQKQIKGLNKQVKSTLDEAEKFAKKSIELKADYASAHMFLTDIYERQGEIDDAIAQISNVVLRNPRSPGLYFQLGLLHYKNEDMARAQRSLEQAVGLNSEYANARYFLGLAYAQEDQNQDALKQFRKVKELNPENEQVKTVISNIEEGKEPLAGIVEGQGEEPVQSEEAPVEEPQNQPATQQNPQAPTGDMQQPQQPQQQPQAPQVQQPQQPQQETQQPQQ